MLKLVIKAGRHQIWKQRCCSLCWKLPDLTQSFVSCSQIVTDRNNAMFLLVSKFKMIGMLLNVVHVRFQKSQQKHITKESNGFYKHSSLIPVLPRKRNWNLWKDRESSYVRNFIIIQSIQIRLRKLNLPESWAKCYRKSLESLKSKAKRLVFRLTQWFDVWPLCFVLLGDRSRFSWFCQWIQHYQYYKVVHSHCEVSRKSNILFKCLYL